ncbi:MAG: hypothetical protein NVS2B14_11570 [Chamaesiphon sp.]
MNNKVLGAALTSILIGFGLMAEGAKAASFTFSKIVDTNDLIPGSSTQKFAFNIYDIPAVNNGKVVFGTVNPDGSTWTANIDGTNLTKVVDTNTPIPSSSGNFGTGFGNLIQINNGTVVFIGYDNNVVARGLYAVPAQGGTVTKLVDTNDLIPDLIPASNQKFTNFSGDFNVNNGTVVFASSNQQTYSVPVSGGSISVVADNNNPRGANPCCLFDSPRLSNGTVILKNGNVFGRAALAIGNLDPKSLLAEIATGGTPTPGGSSQNLLFDNFTFSTPVIDNGTVAFYAASNPASQPNNDVVQGIYSYINGSLNQLVDTNTPVPGGTGNFVRFGNFGNRNGISLSNGMVVFQGADAATVQDLNGGESIYAVPATGGLVTKIIGPGDQLNGHTLSNLNIDQNSFSTGQLAIEAFYKDGGAGIYVANSVTAVPEPSSTLGILVFGGFGFFLYKKRW